MKHQDITHLTVRELAQAVRREGFTLAQAHEELARRKAMGATLDADEQPGDGEASR